MSAANIHISLAAEPVVHFGHLEISNSILAAWIIIAVIVLGAFLLRRSLRTIPGKAQSVVEMIFLYLLGTTESVIGRKDVARDLFPFILTAFTFILFSNWSGLLPGVGSIGLNHATDHGNVLTPLFRAPTADLNMVAAMAISAVIYVQYLGFKYLGAKNHLKKFFNFSNPIYTFVGFIELISEFTRIVSFSFRLFGNVFAGEVLIGVIFYLTYSLMPYVPIIPLPFFLLELFVGLVQAFVFCFLTIVFTSVAVADHGGHDDHAAAHPVKA